MGRRGREKRKKEIVERRVITEGRRGEGGGTHGRKTERYLSARGSTGVEALSTRSIYNNYKAQCNEAAAFPFTVPSDIGLFHYGKSTLIVQINRSFFSTVHRSLSPPSFVRKEEEEEKEKGEEEKIETLPVDTRVEREPILRNNRRLVKQCVKTGRVITNAAILEIVS